MKPDFALTLSFDGIGLLRRAPEGWERVGEVPLDVPDLSAALDVLKSSAHGLGSDTLQSKLILPDEQVKYITIVDPQGGDEVQAEAVRHALDGATPYSLDQLAYDWTVDGQMLHIAAVARETLAEAEGFAAEHGFEPLYFAAMPVQGRFGKEPCFGITDFYADQGGHIDTLELDAKPVKITGVARPLPVTPEADKEDKDQPDAQPEADPVESDADSETETNSVSGTELTAQMSADLDAALSDDAPFVPEKDADSEADLEAASEPDSEATAPKAEPKVKDLEPVKPATEPEIEPEADKAEDEAKVEADALTTEPSAVEPATEASPPRAPVAPSPPSFASRRSQAEVTNEAGVAPKLAGVSREDTAVSAPSIPIDPSDPATTLTPPPMPASPSAEGGVMAFFSRRNTGKSGAKADVTAESTRKSFSLQSLRRTPPARTEPQASAVPPPNLVPPPESEKQRLTVFGARKPEQPTKKVAAIGGKPRFLGLILTAALLVFLIGVAAWASVFVDDGLSRFFKRSNTDFAVAPDAPDETLTEGDEAGLPDATLELAALDPENQTRVEPRIMPKQIDPISLEEAQVKYAVTGIWMMPPAAPDMPVPQGEDDLYVASIDRDIGSNDAIALPALDFDLSDRGMDKQANPALQGQKFALDARGLVIATAAGALSPDGHLVYLGKPAYFPTKLPDRAELAAEIEAATPDPAMARLAAFRPKLRPETLAENNQRATLGGRSLTELAALRPKLRPPSVREMAEAKPVVIPEVAPEDVPQTPGAVVIKLPEVAATPGRDLDPNATPQAVARSMKPKPRPRNITQIVRRAERNKEEVTQVAAVAPKTVTPRIPSAASVSKQATVRNAINLRRVNLIGVYGKPSSRRALVRMSNGRYKKVKVGDRIDGGRISAIGDTELRYQKNGRNVTLKMPKG